MSKDSGLATEKSNGLNESIASLLSINSLIKTSLIESYSKECFGKSVELHFLFFIFLCFLLLFNFCSNMRNKLKHFLVISNRNINI